MNLAEIKDGVYVNLNRVESVRLVNNQGGFAWQISMSDSDNDTMTDRFETKEQAEKWLIKFSNKG